MNIDETIKNIQSNTKGAISIKNILMDFHRGIFVKAKKKKPGDVLWLLIL